MRRFSKVVELNFVGLIQLLGIAKCAPAESPSMATPRPGYSEPGVVISFQIPIPGLKKSIPVSVQIPKLLKFSPSPNPKILKFDLNPNPHLKIRKKSSQSRSQISGIWN